MPTQHEALADDGESGFLCFWITTAAAHRTFRA